ncbi:ATP-dependent DNA helicase PIF1 [Colletotrichum camelliae]|nr:ATP-dependent DNA helicase PIF1 [Colletotrichum camelliae]
MVENQFFERLSRVMSIIRNDPRLFGGVQDEAFVSVLQKCRLGKPLSKPDVHLLLAHETDIENGTELYATRKEVETHNNKENQKNKNRARKYYCLDDFCGPENSDGELPEEFIDYTVNSKPPSHVEEIEEFPYLDQSSLDVSSQEERRADQSCGQVLNQMAMAPASQKPLKCLDDHCYAMCLELKVDMPVILLANIDLGAGLCNGRQGKIIGFKPLAEMPREPSGQNYKHDPDGFIVAWHRYDHMMKFITSEATPQEFPEVEFTNGIRRIIGPDTTANNIGRTSPYWLLSRTQIPLIPGWSMTIHKSQSLTLDRVTANLSKTFETGQAYVALSRARSLKGLKIKGCTMTKLRDCMTVDPVVKRFMDSMEAAESAETAETTPSLRDMRDRFFGKRKEAAETEPTMRDRFIVKREEAVAIKEEPQDRPAFFFDVQRG